MGVHVVPSCESSMAAWSSPSLTYQSQKASSLVPLGGMVSCRDSVSRADVLVAPSTALAHSALAPAWRLAPDACQPMAPVPSVVALHWSRPDSASSARWVMRTSLSCTSYELGPSVPALEAAVHVSVNLEPTLVPGSDRTGAVSVGTGDA